MGSYTSAISGCAGYCGKPKTAAQTIDIDGPVRISIPNGKTDYTPKKVIEVLDEKYQKTSESKKKEKEKNKNNKKQEEDDEKGSKLRARSKTNLIEDNKLKDTSQPARFLPLHVLPHSKQQISTSWRVNTWTNHHGSFQTFDQANQTVSRCKEQSIQATTLGQLQTVSKVQTCSGHLYWISWKIWKIVLETLEGSQH